MKRSTARIVRGGASSCGLDRRGEERSDSGRASCGRRRLPRVQPGSSSKGGPPTHPQFSFGARGPLSSPLLPEVCSSLLTR